MTNRPKSDSMKQATLLDQEWMEPATLAGRIGVTETTLAVWRSTGRGPASLKLGRRVVYPRSDVETWLQSLRESRNGNKEPQRPMGLPNLRRRARGGGEEHRFGRKRLKSESRAEDTRQPAPRTAGGAQVPAA